MPRSRLKRIPPGAGAKNELRERHKGLFFLDSSVNEALIEEPVFPGSKVYILILAYIR